MKIHHFQWQEHGHIARNCPYIRCFEYDQVWPHCNGLSTDRIPPMRTPGKHHPSKLHKSHHTTSNSRHHHEDRDRRSHSRSKSHFHRHCSSSHHDSYRGHSRSQRRDNHQHHRSCQLMMLKFHMQELQPLILPLWHTTLTTLHIICMHRSSSSYHSRDRSCSCLCPSYKSSRWDEHRSHLHSSRIKKQTSSQEEHQQWK